MPEAERRNQLALLWSDYSESLSPDHGELATVQRLSSHGHWSVPVMISLEETWTLYPSHMAAPVFDGPEDRNGRRNADEIRLAADRLATDAEAQGDAFRPIVAGTLNADPRDGERRAGALLPLLASTHLVDPLPSSQGGRIAGDADSGANDGHLGDPALDTVDWPDAGKGAPGNLRVDYILPSARFRVLGSGVHWPEPGAPGADAATRASRHRVIWVDLHTPASGAP
jgi:hypothetical protein